MNTLSCENQTRRLQLFGQDAIVGMDYLDVAGDGKELTVYFIGRAPASLDDDNCWRHFRVAGGRRIRDIQVTGGEVIRHAHQPPRKADKPWLDDRVKLRLDRSGDFSRYTLRLVELEETPDPLYDHLDFSFKVDCPSDLDCKPVDLCPPERRREPEISYLAKDYESLRQLIYDRLAVIMPEWRERHVPDLGVTLVELLAYTGDHLSYYQDAVATEAYLDTARRRISVRRHARLVDYFLHEGCNARAWVCIRIGDAVQPVTLNLADIQLATSLSAVAPDVGPIFPRHELERLPSDAYLVFEPVMAGPWGEAGERNIELWSAHNEIRFYAWGQRECCLPKGTTDATLLDQEPPEPVEKPDEGVDLAGKNPAQQVVPPARARRLHLQPGDVLIFEELLGPRTGSAADADPAHRHAVRLTRVEQGVDPLDGTLVLEIQWADEDALPFPLCLSSVTEPDHGCLFIEAVSIARGNVLLVDHGQTWSDPEDLGQVPTDLSEAECICPGHPGDVDKRPGRYGPALSRTPLTHSEPAFLDGPAAAAVAQEPRRALPALGLRSDPGGQIWRSRRDLIGSDGDDRHFVVEIDNEGRANLRFGDGECGLQPPAGAAFTARYRTGNGRMGNVGAEAIAHLVYREQRPGGIDGLRNPLPASGGTDPEPMAEAKLLAPTAFRKALQRAIVPADYAAIAERNPAVQRAAAVLRWSGSWYEVQVAVDPRGSPVLEPALAAEIECDLLRYRRIGHDLRIVPARYVPLDIVLEVCVKPDYLRGHVKAALLRIFGTGLLPHGSPAFFHPDNLSFGAGLRASALVAAAQAVDGVESVYLARLQRRFEGADHELENGILPLGPLEVARCDNDPSFPEHGRFEMIMRGGR